MNSLLVNSFSNSSVPAIIYQSPNLTKPLPPPVIPLLKNISPAVKKEWMKKCSSEETFDDEASIEETLDDDELIETESGFISVC